MTDAPAPSFARHPRRADARRQPVAVPGDEGLFVVDATWGTIQPHTLPGGVETIAELEVIAHLEAGGRAVDTRQPDQVAAGTLPGAVGIRHEEIIGRLPDVDDGGTIVLFCNGPQCAATPDAVAQLLDAGWNPARMRYYRGGIHDWVTLGLPLVP